MDIVTSLGTAIGVAKKLHELGKKVSDADFKIMLAELTDALGDAKLEAADLKMQLAEAEEEVQALKSAVAKREAALPEIHDHAYVFEDRSRHYCTGCYDIRGQKILLNQLSGAFTAFGKWECPACDKTYG